MIIGTEAVVLHARKYGDTSKIVSFFTRDEGIISTIAKGARLPKNSFGSSLEPMCWSSINYYRKPGRELHLLSKAETIVNFSNIISSVERLAIGLTFLEAITQSQELNVPNEELFSLLTKSLSIINTPGTNYYSVFICFQANLTEILGFHIDFQVPGQFEDHERMDEIYFSLEDGSVSAYNQVGNGSYRLNTGTLKLLNILSVMDLDKSANVEFPKEYFEQASSFFSQYFSYHLDKKFSYRSLNLLK
jgi:DNA repair protein RecO (recombination protein O)